jgi:hypothetical protein
MPFDADLVLHDGTTITADITPTSATRTSGSAVIDLKKAPVEGLAVVMTLDTELAESSDTLQVYVEESNTVGSGYTRVGAFALVTQGDGVPARHVIKVNCKRRFMRARIDITDADTGTDFTVANVRILLDSASRRSSYV